MKYFKFVELDNKAQSKAISDYIKGYIEGHGKPCSPPTIKDVISILSLDLSHEFYTKKGKLYDNGKDT